MTGRKTRPSSASVRAFLASHDDRVRLDCAVLAKLMREATGARATMWGASIVGYGAYHYRYASGREGDGFLTGFAPRAANLTIYIVPGFSAYGELLGALGKHKTSKSCLYLKELADVDVATLRTLIARSVADLRAKCGS